MGSQWSNYWKKIMKNINLQIIKAFRISTFLVLLVLGFSQMSVAGEKFVKNIHIKGNTLIDPYILEDHFNLGNGLIMNPHIMDLASSELRSIYRYYGHPDIDSYSINIKNKSTLILKVNEEREYRYGAARAKLAIDNLDWNFNMKTKKKAKEEIIRSLVKGYKKIKLNDEIVNDYLIKNQRARIEEIESAKKNSMREKIAKAIISFKEKNIAKDKNQAKKIKQMRERIQLLGKEKELADQAPQIIEYGEITPAERNPY